MVFRKSARHGPTAVLHVRSIETPVVRGAPAVAPGYARSAQAFYCGVLQGRQVSDSEGAGHLCFVVAGTRVDLGGSPAESIALRVDDPEKLAQRCWDAGYSVQVGDEAMDARIFVIDPFGRRIELVR